MGEEKSREASEDQLPEPLSIIIKNCNSIDEAKVALQPGALNIKYGPNGIGKSTIARALKLSADGAVALNDLRPFKYHGKPADDHTMPQVEGASEIESVLVFDDQYVSQFTFQRDEVLRDSFEVFINTEDYRRGAAEIEMLLNEVRSALADDEMFDAAVRDFATLRDAFAVTKSGQLSRSSKGFKALAVGGALDIVPEPLKGYSDFIHGDNPADWVTWQSKGKPYLDRSDSCPFCSVPKIDKETVRQVSETYESSTVKNMTALRVAIENLGRYFNPDSLERLEQITRSIQEPSKEQLQFLAELRGQVKTLLEKLEALRKLSFWSLRDVENVDSQLAELRIDLDFLVHLRSDSTSEVVAQINHQISEGRNKINEIRAKLGRQKGRVERLIRENQKSINDFLESAGYRYRVRIEPSGESYRMILEHRDAPGHISEASSHLSYGEKNAFALILFLHQVRHERPDLVILDDPVSSFDRTKKFAIFHRLFNGIDSIRNETTLLLTHDIEPVVDIIMTGASRYFKAAQPVAHFLRSRSGSVDEMIIVKSDIESFASVCRSNIDAAPDDVIKCIHLRRLLEVDGSRGAEYDVLSSLLHGRDRPTTLVDDGYVELEAAEIASATEVIRRHIRDFDYAAVLAGVRDGDAIIKVFRGTDVGYERVQIVRLLLDVHAATFKPNLDAALRKFINETLHIENEYLMQLDPRRFNAVPEYVLDECERIVDEFAVVCGQV